MESLVLTTACRVARQSAKGYTAASKGRLVMTEEFLKWRDETKRIARSIGIAILFLA
jgi:hypothetical protein